MEKALIAELKERTKAKFIFSCGCEGAIGGHGRPGHARAANRSASRSFATSRLSSAASSSSSSSPSSTASSPRRPPPQVYLYNYIDLFNFYLLSYLAFSLFFQMFSPLLCFCFILIKTM